ncbi:MAG: HAMP domain-containing protein [Rhodospirillales bacterium]|nr:HAMP domain-containing protein [Rhodospirillales bacterium]
MKSGLHGMAERARELSRSLIVRLIALALFLIFMALFLRIAVMFPFLKNRMGELSASRQWTIAEYAANDVDDRIRTRKELIASLARQLPPKLLQDPAGLETWLRERHEIYPKFSRGLVVLPVSGQGVLAEFPAVFGRAGLDFSSSDWFEQALRLKQPVIGKPFRGRTDNIPLIVMSAPVLDETGRVRAVLSGATEIAAPDFLGQIATRKIGQTGGFLLISPKDNLFVSADRPEMILKPLPKPGVNLLHDKAMAGYRGTGITVNAFGVEELSAMASVPVTDWFLVARVPTREAFEAVDTTLTFAFRAAALSAGTISLFLLWFLPRMFKPLTNTSRLIHRMAEGEIDLQPVPVVRKDEVGELALGFNYLLSRLDEMTEQKLAEQQLRLAERERMENSLRQWMADTSHELRTPIAVMRAQVEAIQDGIHEADDRTLSVLHREVMGLTQLVDDLYTLARSDVGQLDCQHLPLDPLDSLDETVSAFKSRFAESGLMIEWDKDHALAAPTVLGDPVRLKQVFANLVENTLRYTDSGGRLRIQAARVGGRFVVYFDDTAPGVPDEALPRLFERFYRVDASRSRDHGGSGIGLCVSKSLIAAMGGEIEAAHSELGGLRIMVSLPCGQGEEE